MSIMPAGVLDVGHRRLVGHVDEFWDRQGVHVGAHRHHLARPASLQHSDHARDADLLAHLVEPERAEAIGDQFRRPRLAKTQLRVLMDISPRLDKPGPERRRLGRHALEHGRRDADLLRRGKGGQAEGQHEGANQGSHRRDRT